VNWSVLARDNRADMWATGRIARDGKDTMSRPLFNSFVLIYFGRLIFHLSEEVSDEI